MQNKKTIPQSPQLSIEQALSKAKKAIKQKNFTLAQQLYSAILQQQPQHKIAKKGLHKLQKSNPINQVKPAQALSPSKDQINALIELYNTGRSAKAEQICRELLLTYPQSLFLFNMLGAALKAQGKFTEAIQTFDKAIQLNPEHPEAYNNRGIVFGDIGQLDQAVNNYDKAIQLKPDYLEAWFNRGNALKELIQPKQAVTCYTKAIQLKLDYVEAYNNLGITLQDLGQTEQAIKNYDKAIQLKPDYAEAYSNRSNALLLLEDPQKINEAFLNIRKAISIDSKNNLFLLGFTSCLQKMKLTFCDDALETTLLQALQNPTIRSGSLSKAIFSALHHQPAFIKAIELFNIGFIEKDIDNITAQLSSIPLFLRTMESSPIANLDIENMFTQIRKTILNKTINKKGEAHGLPFYAALAIHCFINEYVFFETDDEKLKIEQLQQEINTLFKNGESIPALWITAIGAYRPLNNFSWSTILLKPENSDPIKKLIIVQIKNVREEQALRAQIPSLTPIDNKVSQLVRKQYEENPYPRWVNPGLSDKPRPVYQALKHLKYPLNFHNQAFPNNPNILIAGCGTGQHPISTASKFLNCNILALDLSLSSLAYAARKTRELNISNIKYVQGDILQLKTLEKTFDIIESVGVLHHMDEPLAGWKILTDKLRKGGLMRIGLYSEIARKSIVEARSLIAQNNYTSSPEDIRKCRTDIINMAINSKKSIKQLSTINDFYSLSECRDLIFHVQEHRFTLPQIEEALNDLGLKFLGFQLEKSWIRNEFSKLYPEKDAAVSLPLWHQFELKNPNIFKGMYQFWVQKA